MNSYTDYRRWIAYVMIFTLVNFSLLGLVNYVVDPFRVFGSNIFSRQIEMNERFVKIDFLEKNNHKFNAYLFGSSRIGVTEPKIVEQYIPNSKFYNFTLSSANLYDYEKYLKFFIENRYPIKTLYLQLDLDNMSNYGQNEFNYTYKPHPKVNDELTSLFYMKYLVGFFPLSISSKVMNNINHTKNKHYQIEKGTWTMDDNEISLEKSCKEYVKRVPSFNFKNRRVTRYVTKNANMRALSRVVELCQREKIKLYVFVTPHNHNYMDTLILSEYRAYLQDIAKITSFYDFSGYNSVTENDCNYYEMSHYRPHVAKWIAGRIFNDKNITLPHDFGKFIKKGMLYDKK